MGVDLNAVNDDGRTALDAAQALKYESVVKFLADRGAKAGAPLQHPSRAPVSRRVVLNRSTIFALACPT